MFRVREPHVWKSRWPSWAPRPNELYVDVKQHWTMHTHWLQFVPNMSTRHPRTLSSSSSSSTWNVGWGDSVCRRFPTLVHDLLSFIAYKCSGTSRSGSCTPTSGISTRELFWLTSTETRLFIRDRDKGGRGRKSECWIAGVKPEDQECREPPPKQQRC